MAALLHTLRRPKPSFSTTRYFLTTAEIVMTAKRRRPTVSGCTGFTGYFYLMCSSISTVAVDGLSIWENRHKIHSNRITFNPRRKWYLDNVHPKESSQRRSFQTQFRFFSSTDNEDKEENTFATSYHAPVMWKECIEALLDCERGRIRNQSLENDVNDEIQPQQPLVFVDGTLGGGGHSAALLQRLKAGDVVLGCDIDPNALQTASLRLQDYMDHPGDERPLFVPVLSNFGDLATVLPTVTYASTETRILEGFENNVDGILLDLGVSSHQIDEPERGFSFMRDGPLDMRMGNSESNKSGLTAADICNEFDERELQRIFSQYGDEPRAKTLAKAIVKHRPLSTTAELVDAIGSVTPAYAKNKRQGRTATCARIFQSLRIVVNNEDGVLNRVLTEACPTLLRAGGRLVVMSYHSMEDRSTKRIMRDGSLDKNRRAWNDERDVYGNYVGPAKPFKPVGKKQKATEEETLRNPRARSAVLRVGERQDAT